jgi:uncharacterized protein YndB with AHSA1/START domain
MTIGELDRSGPRPQLRFTRALPHSPEKVWRAITEPKHRKNWFPDTVEGEFVAVGPGTRDADGSCASRRDAV